MHRERLERLVTLLEGLPDEGFDLSEFVAFDPNDNPECQTVACACGWAAMDPWFNEQGLKVADYQGKLLSATEMKSRLAQAQDMHEDSDFLIGFRDPESGRLLLALDAAGAFFGLTEGQAEELFVAGDGYDTREDVITRLKGVLSGTYRFS